MNEAYENLLTRRGYHCYSPEPIPQVDLEKILRAGTYAPTGRDWQSPIILAVTNREMRDRLSKMNAAVLNNGVKDPFYGAPVVLAVLADKTIDTYLYDGSLVMGNLMLAAHALGYASRWIHRAKEVFETQEGKAILRQLGINADQYEGVGHCILGYPGEEPPVPKPRKKNYVYYIK